MHSSTFIPSQAAGAQTTGLGDQVGKDGFHVIDGERTVSGDVPKPTMAIWVKSDPIPTSFPLWSIKAARQSWYGAGP